VEGGVAGALFSVWDFPVFVDDRRGDKMGIFYHLDIGTRNQKFLENLKSAAYLT